MKLKLTPTYIAAVSIVVLILISISFTIGSWLGWWGVIEVYAMIQTFIINWVIVITFAILGGILFGMYVGFKLSTQGFTPFEKSMLTMFTRVEDIHERVKRIEEKQSISSSQENGEGEGEKVKDEALVREGDVKEKRVEEEAGVREKD